MWASNEAQRDCKYYEVVRRLGVNTARLVFAFGERDRWGWKRRLVATRALTGFTPLPEYFEHMTLKLWEFIEKKYASVG